MGLFDKLKKEIKKNYDKVTDYVEEKASNAVGGVGKIVSGDVKEGLGDLGQTAASIGLDSVTGGNKQLVDQASGGVLTRAELAARGNSKDIISTGAVLGATVYGGPASGLAASNIIGNFGVNAQSLASIGLNTASTQFDGLGGDLLSRIANTFTAKASPDGKSVESGYFSTQSGYQAQRKTNMFIPLALGLSGVIFLIALAKKG